MQTEYQRQQAIRARCYHPTGRWEPFTAPTANESVVTRFEAIVDRYPDRLALQMDAEQLTYRALNDAANQLANVILAQRGAGPEPLAFLFTQSVQAIVAMLAVWKAGKFFITLNPTDPPARLAQLLQDSRASAIVTTSHQRNLLDTLPSDHPRLFVDEIAADSPGSTPAHPTQAADLACILYTSGSTGQPKGVVYTQRNVLYRVQQYTNLIHLCAEDRVALVEYYSFNGSLRDIFSTLLNGAALFLFNLKINRAESFAQLLQRAAITLWVPVVTAWRAVSSTLQAANLPHLRVLGMTGETLHRQDLERYRQCTPPTCLLSLGLGSSETVGAILCGWFDHQSALPTQAVSLGYPVDEVEVRLLDENGQPVPTGTIGEIVIRSGDLAQGYWQQPALTARTFIADPQDSRQQIHSTGDLARQNPDGQFVHLGRKDQQIKIRGHRVELVEIEQALAAWTAISAVVVVARRESTAEQQLIAYLVPATPTVPTTTEFRQYLRQRLPDYMLPTHFVMLDALPLTVTGKVDRGALPAPTAARPTLATAYHAPRTPLEAQMTAIWCAALGLDRVGIHDNFLEIGGNSLVAFQLIAQVFACFQVSIPIQRLFDAPTIADMALVITQHQAAKLDRSTLDSLLNQIERLSGQAAIELSAIV